MICISTVSLAARLNGFSSDFAPRNSFILNVAGIGRSERGVQIEDPLALERRIRRYHAGQRDEAGDRGVDDAGIGGSRPVRSRYGVGLAELVHFDYEGDELEQVTVVDKAPNCGQSYKKT